MKYTDKIIEDRLKPPSVIILNNDAATISKHTQTVMIFVRTSMLTVQVGILPLN